jgi:hypothetical protein
LARAARFWYLEAVGHDAGRGRRLRIQRVRRRSLIGALVAVALLAPVASSAQQIQLDDPVRAGSLTLFASVQDARKFYYVPARARLATNPDGRPQFSLLRYVQNVGSKPGEDDKDTGEGGGILHAVVQLGVTDEEVDEARRELRRQRSDAEIAGPVIFKAGKFALTSNFADANGTFTERVVGVGAAPILDGSKAAVSLRLTKLGAELIWQSFQSATPDLTFQFEMEMAGYRAPMRAVLEADFERIYSHEKFNVAVATPFVASEINQTFDELRNSGAIKLDIIGNNDKLREMIDFAYRKISEMMFQAAGAGTGTPDLAQLKDAPGGSLLDKATKRLADARKEVRESNAKIRDERRKVRAEHAKRLAERTKQLGELVKKAEAAKADPKMLEIVRAEAAYSGVIAYGAQDAGFAEDTGLAEELGEIPEQEALPEFSALAIYELRKTRRTDHYKIDLNQSLPDTLPIVFSENIGDLSRFIGDEKVFRNVNLDDPLYKQREIVAFVTGADAADFDKYIAFASVEMRKHHQSGDDTFGHVRIDRKSFNDEANRFKMVYGWKGDDDRRAWRNFEYRTLWSFRDGTVVEEPWRAWSFTEIALVPPYLRRTVSLEALDPERLKTAGVNVVTVTLFYDLNGKEQSVRASLRPDRGNASADLDLLLPKDKDDYAYEIQWMRGNRMVSSGRQTSNSSVLFIDGVPES